MANQAKKNTPPKKTAKRPTHTSSSRSKKSTSLRSYGAKAVKKGAVRLSGGQIALILLFLIIGLIAGVTLCQLITENDTFSLIGKKEYKISIGEEFFYKDEGVEIISFGKDLSDKAEIKTDLTRTEDGYTLDTSKEGRYYMAYTVDSLKFGNIKRVRTFIVGGES